MIKNIYNAINTSKILFVLKFGFLIFRKMIIFLNKF